MGKWAPGCYRGDGQTHSFKVGLVADVRAHQKHGARLKPMIEDLVARTSFVYENQLNIRLLIGTVKIYTSSNNAPDYAKGCPSINKRLDQLSWAASSLPREGALHLLTGCGTGYGVVGLAYMRGVCSTRGYNTGVNQLQNSRSWVTFAHELGHNFGGDHTFERGQGWTGGIMDYGDGKLGGQYQFNTKYRKGEMCREMNRVVGRCGGNFKPAKPLSCESQCASNTAQWDQKCLTEAC